MTYSQPNSRSVATLLALETTPIGVPPQLRTCWTAKEPMPPDAPQISTLSPWVTGAPWRETSIR